MSKLSFSGHETFQCRNLWLNKGYNFLQQGNRFHQPDAVVRLGVGKNMVSSIRYWMNAFGLLDKPGDDQLGKFLLGARGKDPFLEDIGSLWLLHYRLVTHGVASIYSLVFNEFRKERAEFTKGHLLGFLKRRCQLTGTEYNEHILERDIGVFLKTYLPPRTRVSNLEDEVSGIFLDLDLIEELDDGEGELGKRYRILSSDRKSIPSEIIMFCILENASYGNSVSFYELLSGNNSVGAVFAMDSEGLMQKILDLTVRFKDITYNEDAGIREVQFKAKPDHWDVLKSYYAK